eukprot:18161-Heterococcus_DN1.PRE.2
MALACCWLRAVTKARAKTALSLVWLWPTMHYRSDSSSSCIAERTHSTQRSFEVTAEAAMNTVRLKFTPKQGEESAAAKPRNAMLHSTRLLMSREQRGQRLRQLRGDQIVHLPQTKGFVSKLDRNLERVPSLVRALRSALQARDMGLIIDAVRAITLKLVDHPGVSLSGRPPAPVPDFPGEIDHRVQRLDRYYFAALGGPELMLQLFQRPFALPDVREMKPHLLARRIDVWSEVLVLLRELCFTDHDLSARLTSDSFLMQLFTMMSELQLPAFLVAALQQQQVAPSHALTRCTPATTCVFALQRGLFESAVSLAEELLAVSPRTFNLALVPNFYALFDGLSSAQAAHLCRLVALLVFEPEDRIRLELAAHAGTGSSSDSSESAQQQQPVRSLELVQMRRDRMSRPCPYIDINQAVLLGSPALLPKMVQLLKVIAYFPAVDQWYAADSLDAVAQLMLHGQTARQLSNDWSHIDTLLSTAAAGSSGATAATAGALRSLPRATSGVLRGAVAGAVAGAAAHLGAAATATAGDGTRATAAAAGAVMGAVTGGFIGEVARWLFDRQPNAFAATPPAPPTAAAAAAADTGAADSTAGADATAGTDAAAAAAAAIDSTDNAPIEVPGDVPAPRNDGGGPQLRVQL